MNLSQNWPKKWLDKRGIVHTAILFTVFLLVFYGSVCACRKEYKEIIHWLWLQEEESYNKWIKMSRTDPNYLYMLQSSTNNLLKYAYYCKDYYILHELITLYAKALMTLDETEEYLLRV